MQIIQKFEKDVIISMFLPNTISGSDFRLEERNERKFRKSIGRNDDTAARIFGQTDQKSYRRDRHC